MPIDRPLPDDTREALKMLWSINEDQQANIDRHRDSLHKVWHVAPVKPREGMLVYADGTNWNPGSGAGYYVYYAGAWHPMSGGGGGGGGGYTTVQDEGVALTVRTTLNFVGAGVTATDDGTRTVVTIPGGGGAGAVTSVFTRTGAVIAVSGDYTAAQVTNAVSVLGSYPNPTWIPSYAYSKLTGVPTTFTPSAHVHAAADTTSGVFAVARLGTGTPSASNYLRGDGTWATVTAGSSQTPWLSDINAASFLLNSAGGIGIGAAALGSTGIFVSSTAIFDSLKQTNTSSNGWAGLTFQNNLGHTFAATIYGSARTPPDIARIEVSGCPLAFTMGAVECVRITAAGQVGIGTSSPQTVLQVWGNTAAVPAAGTYGGAIFSNDANQYGLYVGCIGTGMGYVQMQRGDSATTYDLALQPNGGNVGIGIVPTAKVHVAQSFADTVIFGSPMLLLQNKSATAGTGCGIQSQNAGGGITSEIRFFNGPGSGTYPNNGGSIAFSTYNGAGGGGVEYMRIGPTGILLFLGGTMKTLSVDGSGFVKAT